MGYSLNKSKISETINTVILYHSKLEHSHEVAWALWLSKTLEIPIREEAAKEISKMEDSVVALISLDLYYKNGLIPLGLDLTKWKKIATIDNLYSENWLLSYEANIQGWLTSLNKSDYISEDPVFSTLKNHQVSFYDSKKQVIPVFAEIEEDDGSSDEFDYDHFFY